MKRFQQTLQRGTGFRFTITPPPHVLCGNDLPFAGGLAIKLAVMARMSGLRVSVGLPHSLACALIFIFSIVFYGATCAQQEDSAPLPAEQIIQILQQNPDVLAEAKTQIVNVLRDRGYAVTPAEITDDRLFSQIRSDERVRTVISDELKRRGFGEETAEGSDGQAVAPQKPAAPAGSSTRPSSSAKPTPESDTNKKSGQAYYPYRNLPVLNDLYTQAIADPSKLER